jgi:diaminopimelate decarboxylase
MSANRLTSNYNRIEKAFSTYHRSRVYYSVKTNYNLFVLRVLQKAGSGAEVCSGMELYLAKQAGFKAQDIVMDGACWTDEEVREAIMSEIAMLNIDSKFMLNKVVSIAKTLKIAPHISFRINPRIKISFMQSFIEGYISRFGIDISEALKFYDEAFRAENVVVDGLAMHIGSGIVNPKVYVDALKPMMKLYSQLGRKFVMFNIGGGYPVQSMKSVSTTAFILQRVGFDRYEKAPPIEEFSKEIYPCVSGLSDATTLALEPGRYISGDSGVLVTKVASVKDKWVFLDGGINLLSESAFFSRRGFLLADQAKNEGKLRKVNIAGNGLNTVDVLAVSQQFPKVNVGDVVVVLDAGAYSLSRANQFIYLRPEALMVDNGKVSCIQRKEIYHDIMRMYEHE